MSFTLNTLVLIFNGSKIFLRSGAELECHLNKVLCLFKLTTANPRLICTAATGQGWPSGQGSTCIHVLQYVWSFSNCTLRLLMSDGKQ